MRLRIAKLYKSFKHLKMALSLARKGYRAGVWLLRAYQKHSLKRRNQEHSPHYEVDDVGSGSKGWQHKASEKVRGWSENRQSSHGWQPPNSAAPYLKSIRQAEQQEGIPAGVLARLIYQECRYREDIICGKVVSPAGAVGIAQIVPRWHPEARPLDPEHSIFYAARYLAQLNRQFNDWPAALAAYNWGSGNVNKARMQHGRNWLEKAPKETRNYVSQIGRDTGLL